MGFFQNIWKFFSNIFNDPAIIQVEESILTGNAPQELVYSIQKASEEVLKLKTDALKKDSMKTMKMKLAAATDFQSVFNFFFVPPQASFSDYHKDWPVWLVWLDWNVRNPLPGLNDMLGCKDLIFTTVGETVDDKNVHGLTWNPLGGFNQLTHTVTATGKIYHFISYRGNYVEWYCGTRPTGSFGVALRKAHAGGF